MLILHCVVLGLALPLALALTSARRAAIGLRRRIVALQDAADAERGRLSHELHDEIGQKLIALKMHMQMSRLPGATSAASHEASVALLDSVIGEVRLLSHSLRPAPFDEGLLIPALTALAKTEGERAGVCVLVDAPAAATALPRKIELACYRVVREAFANIAKHARARNVAVMVRQDDGAIALTVSDDGRGFEVEPVTRQAVRGGRLGLVGMQERIGLVGGTLNIVSKPGSGTTVECRIPLAALA